MGGYVSADRYEFPYQRVSEILVAQRPTKEHIKELVALAKRIHEELWKIEGRANGFEAELNKLKKENTFLIGVINELRNLGDR